jgi:hypothetical protein
MEPQFCSPWLWGSRFTHTKQRQSTKSNYKKERRRTPHLVVIGGVARRVEFFRACGAGGVRPPLARIGGVGGSC